MLVVYPLPDKGNRDSDEAFFSIIGLYGIPTRFAAYGFIVSLTLGAGQLEYMF